MEATVGDRQLQQRHQEVMLLALFRSMRDDRKADALHAIEALARAFPRRASVNLQLILGNRSGGSTGDA